MSRLHVCMMSVGATCIASSFNCSESRRDVVKVVIPEDIQLEGTVYRLVDIPRQDALHIIIYTDSGRRVELRAQLSHTELNATSPPSEPALQQALGDLRPGDRVRVTGPPLLVINETVSVVWVTRLSVVARVERSYAPFAF